MANRVLPEITPDLILRAYAAGIFPMSESKDDPGLYWVEPQERGIIPLDGLVVSRSLAKAVKAARFEVRVDHDFRAVIDACAAPADGRDRTWINAPIRRLFGELFALGHVHTVECYDDEGLAGGLYGLALGGAFFGESMFHLRRDASKVALVHLVARLRLGGFCLLDTQFVTPHLASLGAVEVSRRGYRKALAEAIEREAAFTAWPSAQPMPGAVALAAARTGRLDGAPE